MFLTDCHTHSLASPDGFVSMRRMAEAAQAAGVSVLTLTDHYDLLTLDGSARVLSYDWTPVRQEREEMLAAFGDKIELPMGIELGMAQIAPEAAKKVLAQAELDLVIGSIHNRREENGGADFYCGSYQDPTFCHATLDDYFSSMEELAPLDVYDVLGHVIYPLRYMERDGQQISLAPHMEQIREILRIAVQSGHGIEINTYRGQTVEPWREILLLYRDVGGEILTTGSDAHRPEGVGKGIAEAYALMKETGFRYVTVYRQREPVFYKL